MNLKQYLEQLGKNLVQSEQVKKDPLSLVLKYNNNLDRDVAGFIASALAYGNVKQILKSVQLALSFLGSEPYLKLKNSDGFTWKKEIPDTFKHRFNTADDLRILYTWLGEALRQSNSLEEYFTKGYAPHFGSNSASNNNHIAFMLENFIDRITTLSCKPFKKTKGIMFFFSRPSQKSGCKRLLLYLRWMAGSGPFASGHWKNLKLEELIIPVDAHVLRISQNLKLSKRKTADWKTALEITNNLKKLDPQDPTRFDFALCHMGISKVCPSKLKFEICTQCQINKFCRNWKPIIQNRKVNLITSP
ncbi:MAG: TIGR02757 family protein [Oligoflexia bacterium]|nr:TIGR02757 family protein [Oligoflexia bacterium]